MSNAAASHPVSSAEHVSLRRVLQLAVPALGVLAAEPLYLLVDTAVVGHLGGIPLAALSVAAVVLAQVSTQLTFLAYGTTARASRQFGAGNRPAAVAEGLQASWLALGIGLVLLMLGQLLAGPLARLLAGQGQVAEEATGWLRIALCGVPLILLTLAGNGWMRGVQDTRRPLYYVLAGNVVSAVACPLLVYGTAWAGRLWQSSWSVLSWQGMGLHGSAVANVLAQVIAASLFVRAVLRETLHGMDEVGSTDDLSGQAGRPGWRPWWRPRPSVMREQMRMGKDLVLRSLAFQASFVSAASVAARTSAAAAAAHQVVLQLWSFLALVLDSLAIAGQSLIGERLGAGQPAPARRLAWQLTRYGLVFGVGLGAVFAALHAVLPRVFTSDPAVLAQIPYAWWVFVALQPLAGVVFAIDGVLIGAGDAPFLRNSTLAAAVLGFLPLVWLSYAQGWGLLGIWAGLATFMVLRAALVLLRQRSGRWAVPGFDRDEVQT